MSGWQSLLGSEMVISRISYVDQLRTDCSSCWWHHRKGHRSVENVTSMCRGTAAVPVAATDSGEAQTVPRLTKRALVISRETCCDSVKNIVQIELPLRNGMGALLTELTDWVPSIKRYYWSQFLVLVIIALIKAFLLIHSIIYLNKWLSAVVLLYTYTYVGADFHQCYVLYRASSKEFWLGGPDVSLGEIGCHKHRLFSYLLVKYVYLLCELNYNASNSQEIASLSLHYSSGGVKTTFQQLWGHCLAPAVPQFWLHCGGWRLHCGGCSPRS